MTVFRPSLPPVNSMTTSSVSLPPGLREAGAAAAVRLRNRGAFTPRATRPEDFRKLRRVENMDESSSTRPERQRGGCDPLLALGAGNVNRAEIPAASAPGDT